MKALRNVLGIKIGIPNFSIFVTIGGWIIGTEAILVLKGRRVVSTLLKEHDFEFKFPDINAAVEDLLTVK
jgi:NAD dependent epimerase/dehydratase family enzyme